MQQVKFISHGISKSKLFSAQKYHIQPCCTYRLIFFSSGGTPRNLDVLKSESSLNDKVTLFRKVEDYFKLNDITQRIKSVSIIGGGFLGSELACALGSRSRNPDYDLSVTQIYRENGNMAKVRNGCQTSL